MVSFSPVSNIPPPSMARAISTHTATIPITTYRLSQKRVRASRLSLGRGRSGMIRLHVPSSRITTKSAPSEFQVQSSQCLAASHHHGPLRRYRGFKVSDANGQSLAYVYSRENEHDAHMAQVLTEDGARRIASNIAKLPELLRKQ